MFRGKHFSATGWVGAVTGCHWIVIGVSIVNGSHYLPLPQDKIGVSHLAKTNRIYSEGKTPVHCSAGPKSKRKLVKREF